MNWGSWLERLRDMDYPLRVRRGGVTFAAQAQHQSAWEADAVMYALTGVAENVPSGARQAVLYQLLAAPWTGETAILRRVVSLLLGILPADEVLAVFLALRRQRVNHRHASRTVARFILHHPRLDDLIARRRRIVRDCLEHALGCNVVRACAKLAATDDPYLRNVVRHAPDGRRARQALQSMYGPADKPRRRTSRYDSYHARYIHDESVDMPQTVTATNRGDISAALVHIYRGGPTDALKAALERYVAEAVEEMPRFEGHVAVVLDVSGSTRGYGEREYCSISQSVALRMVLERCVSHLVVQTVGGIPSTDPPRPAGATDLATAVLDAVETMPDLVAVITDGYENRVRGDLRRVAEALGDCAPVVLCLSKFSARDSLDFRRPAPSLPQIEFWHEAEFPVVASRLFGRAKNADAFLHTHLFARLRKLEEELKPWSCSEDSALSPTK